MRIHDKRTVASLEAWEREIEAERRDSQGKNELTFVPPPPCDGNHIKDESTGLTSDKCRHYDKCQNQMRACRSFFLYVSEVGRISDFSTDEDTELETWYNSERLPTKKWYIRTYKQKD